MKRIIILLIMFLVAAEGFAFWFYKKQKNSQEKKNVEVVNQEQKSEIKKVESEVVGEDKNSSAWDGYFATFPPPTVEEVDGEIQRVIHMGVRKWQWDPSEIEANYGEKVILILHNADVTHSIFIPEMNIRQEIPEEGAVVMFKADKRGTFEFACDTFCGSGHSSVKGKITIK